MIAETFSDHGDRAELAGWKKLLEKSDIVVTVRGGGVLAVYSNVGGDRHCIIDFDDIKDEVHDYDGVGQALEDMIDARFTITEHA
jgi:hypothetical protein